MSFSTYSGIAIVPTLSRVVLCAAFIAAGYSKVFVTAEFSYEDAQILDSLGVSITHVPPAATAPAATAPATTSPPPTINPPVETPPVIETPPATVPAEEPPVETPPFTITPSPAEEPAVAPPTTEPEPEVEPAPDSPADPPPSAHMNATIVLAAYQQPQPAQPRSPGRLRSASASTQPVAAPSQPAKQPAAQPAKPAKPAPKQTSSITAPPLPPGTYQAKNMYSITVMLDKRGWSYPKGLAIAAAWTELLGGSLLLIGLFSRLCGLGLAGVMVVAFYLTSLNALTGAHFNLLNLTPLESASMFVQLAFFVMAFGIFLTGAGPLSIDRFLFGSPREVIEVEDVNEKI